MMARDIELSVEDLDEMDDVVDSFDERIDDVAMRIDQLDVDSARQQLHLLTMIGRAQMTIIGDKDVKIEELRDRAYDLDNEMAELRDDLETAEADIESLEQRNRVLRDSWERAREDVDRMNGGLRTSVRIMVVMAAFMLVELVVIACLALA